MIHANATRALSQDINRQLYDNNKDIPLKQNMTKIQNVTRAPGQSVNKNQQVVKQKLEKNQALRLNFNKTVSGISKSASNKSIPIENSKLNKTVNKAGTTRTPEVVVKTTKATELRSLSARVAQAKPRYLEPRKRDIEQQTPVKKVQNIKNKLISSSDVSRTPSPKNRLKKGESSNMSLDSLASSQRLKTMSTDSLTPTLDEGDNRLSSVKSKSIKNTPKPSNKIPIKTFRVSRTLTSPTKSSAAKVVAIKKKGNDKKKTETKEERIIPQMERSGTFVKELATE